MLPLACQETAEAELFPQKGFEMGAGKGGSLKTTLTGGVMGLILDGRGRRPLSLPENPEKRIAKLQEWAKALEAYPQVN